MTVPLQEWDHGPFPQSLIFTPHVGEITISPPQGYLFILSGSQTNHSKQELSDFKDVIKDTKNRLEELM